MAAIGRSIQEWLGERRLAAIVLEQPHGQAFEDVFAYGLRGYQRGNAQVLSLPTPPIELFAQPKQRGRRAAAAAPLRELGTDPFSEKPVVVKEGRFGPYVTDGETNASLRKGDEVESITIQRAAELLAERREKVAASGGKKKTAKKTTTRRRTSAKSGS